MLLGESGPAREVLARGLHEASARRGERFVAINCAAIPDNLLESELFGYRRGAFTGAAKTTSGKIEMAHRGTLMLDEIGDLPYPPRPNFSVSCRASDRASRGRQEAGRCPGGLRHPSGPDHADFRG